MKKYLYKIRAHHGMCICYFEGRGYSNSFTEHMTKIINELKRNPLICLSDQTDIICEKCPNNKSGNCSTENLVAKYDQQVFTHCNLIPGTILPFEKFRDKVYENIIHTGRREKICGDCEWNSICLTKEKK